MFHILKSGEVEPNWLLWDTDYLKAERWYSMDYKVIVLYKFSEGIGSNKSLKYDDII